MNRAQSTNNYENSKIHISLISSSMHIPFLMPTPRIKPTSSVKATASVKADQFL